MHLFRASLIVTFILYFASLGMSLPIASSHQRSSSLSPSPLPLSARQTVVSGPYKERVDNSAVSEHSGVPAWNDDLVILVRRKSIFTKIKEGFQKLGHDIRHVAQTVGHGIVTAAKKVGHFVQTTGAKIAKVGLKIAATVGKSVGKVIGLVPGAGKLAGKIADGISDGLNKASDKIHATIGGKLGKAMNNMNKAQKIEGYIPRGLSEDCEWLLDRSGAMNCDGVER